MRRHETRWEKDTNLALKSKRKQISQSTDWRWTEKLFWLQFSQQVKPAASKIDTSLEGFSVTVREAAKAHSDDNEAINKIFWDQCARGCVTLFVFMSADCRETSSCVAELISFAFTTLRACACFDLLRAQAFRFNDAALTQRQCK